MNERGHKCLPTSPKQIDYSKLDFIQVNDTNFIFNGSVTIRETITSPIMITVKGLKMVQGVWVPSPLNHVSEDFCKELEKKRQNWHVVFEDFSPNNRCPFRAKTVEYNNKVMVLEKVTVPPNFYGMYKIQIDIATKKAGTNIKKQLSCMIVELEYIEID